MAIVVWFTVALALWHFTIFVPDRFWEGIMGALIGTVVGGLISGALVQVILGHGLNETGVIAFIAAIPGTLAGAAVIYWMGLRADESEAGT